MSAFNPMDEDREPQLTDVIAIFSAALFAIAVVFGIVVFVVCIKAGCR